MAQRRLISRLTPKLFILIVGAGLLSLVIALTIVYVVQKKALTESIGHQFGTLATITSARLTSLLDQTISEATLLGIDPTIYNAVVDANRRYAGRSPEAIRDEIQHLNQQWDQKTLPEEFRRRYQSSPTALLLRNYLEQPINTNRYFNIRVTDSHGLLVASPFQPNRIDFGNQEWWQSAYRGGKGGNYISDVSLAPSTAEFENTYAIEFAVPIRDQQNQQVIGALSIVSYVGHLFSAVTSVHLGQTDHTMLASSDGELLFCPIFLIKNHTLKPQLIKAISQQQPGWARTEADVHYSGPTINGYAPVIPTAELSPHSFGGQRWYIFTSQNPQETYAPMTNLLMWVGVAGGGGLILLGMVAILFANRFTKPIQELQRGAKLIGFGNLDYRLNIPTGDEIEELSNEFNEMSGKLNAAYAGLEQRVAQRTREIEDRNRQLSILYAVSSSLSAATEIKGLLSTVLATTAQQLGAQVTLIHLIGHQTPLYGSDDHRLPFDRPQLEREALQACQECMQPPAQAVRLKQVALGLGVNPNGLPSPSAGMQSSILIAIPLVSKNRVLGAMVLGYPDGGGVRLEHDRYLLLTLGHQIGAAIEAAQLFEETKKLDQLKSEFVSKVSHELRTPLTSIKGFGEILGSYDDIDPVSRQEFIQIINEESDRLTRLINDLLDLSKIEAGKVEWMIQPIDLGQVLRYTVKQMQAISMKKPVVLALDLPPSIPLALGDRDQLVQVMENLLSNAIKFTPEGTITVGVSWNREEPTGRQTRPGREPAQSDPPQTHHLLTVFVQDNGIGIPPHELAAIFEKFHQITDSDKNRPKGTGLGLALCREILHRLGGEIWCESTLGLGSRFLFTLPVVTPLIMRSTADPSLTRTAPATPGDTHQARTPHIP